MTKNYLVLKPTEEKVVNLLQGGLELSVSDISKKLKLSRSSVYLSVESLIVKNIVSKKGFNYFMCDNNLLKHESRVISVNNQITQLLKSLTGLKKGEIIYSIESDEEIEALFEEKEKFLNWQKEINKKGIILKGIGSKNSLQLFRSKLTKNLSDVIKERGGSARFTNIPINGSCTLITFRNSVFFISRTQDFYFEIDNKYVAEFVRSLFEIFDDTLKYHAITD